MKVINIYLLHMKENLEEQCCSWTVYRPWCSDWRTWGPGGYSWRTPGAGTWTRTGTCGLSWNVWEEEEEFPKQLSQLSPDKQDIN